MTKEEERMIYRILRSRLVIAELTSRNDEKSKEVKIERAQEIYASITDLNKKYPNRKYIFRVKSIRELNKVSFGYIAEEEFKELAMINLNNGEFDWAEN